MSATGTRRVDLAPLTPTAVARLAAEHPGPAEPADRVYRLTGGNPFFATEVLSAGVEQMDGSAGRDLGHDGEPG